MKKIFKKVEKMLDKRVELCYNEYSEREVKMMMIFVWVVVVIGLVLSAIALGIMLNDLVNYIKDKKLKKQVEQEMLKQFKKV